MPSTDAIAELAALLELAKGSAVVLDRHQGTEFSLSTHLPIVDARRRSHDPSFAFSYGLAIQEDAVQERLRNVVRAALGQFAVNDMLQSAAIVIGGSSGGFHIDELIEHLLTISFVKGGVIMDRRGGCERPGVVSTLSDYVRLSVKGKCPLSRLPC